MKIIWFHSDISVLNGGGENYSRNLIKALLKRGHQITIVCVASNSESLNNKIPGGITEIQLPGYWNRQFGQKLLAKLGTYFTPYPTLKSIWVNKIQLGISWRVIKWHNTHFAKKAMEYLSHNWGSYDIAYVHGDPILASKVSQYLACCLRLPGPMGIDYAPFMSSVTWVCANGDALVKLRKLVKNNIDIYELPIGLDTKHFSPVGENFRSLIGMDDFSIVLGYAGRFTILKGIQILGEAFCKIAKDIPNLRLLLVGEGPESESIRNLLNNCSLENHVFWADLQSVDFMPKWYRSMDLFIMPSLYENFSNSILEAMGCGLPVVASAVGGNIELVSAQAGWQFKTGNSEDLARVLKKSLSQNDQWKDMGKAARAIVETQYSWDKTASVFENIVNRNK